MSRVKRVGFCEMDLDEEGKSTISWIPFEQYAQDLGYVKERTCRFVPFVEDDGSVVVENCSKCDAVALARCQYNYCPNCGAKVVE